MTSAIRPSIALPTGPYDWHAEQMPRALFETRLAGLRTVMAEHGVTHTVVHGNGFDHDALLWLTHFTPKLGPAYALVPATGPLRLLFAGGPGMKPSAQKLTWVEDVAAIKTIAADAKRWLDETAGGAPISLGLVEGSAMLRGDWRAVAHAVGEPIELDSHFDRLRQRDNARAPINARASQTLARAQRVIAPLARLGTDLRQLTLALERNAYADGAQDVRVLVGRRPNGAPTTLPDEPLPMSGPTWVHIHLRQDGTWTSALVRLEPVG